VNTQRKKVKIAIVGYTIDLGKELKEYIEKKKIFGDVSFSFFDLSAVDDYSIVGDYSSKPISDLDDGFFFGTATATQHQPDGQHLVPYSTVNRSLLFTII